MRNSFKKTSLIVFTSLILGSSSSLFAQNGESTRGINPYDEISSQSCTSIMVGKKASTDGSVMTTHSCDSDYRTWVRMEPAATYKDGDTQPIYKGMLHNDLPWDFRNVEKVGEIPAPQKTYKYLNTAYPCLNEKQLAIGETTFDGRKELVNKEGWFLIEELQRIALERCTTAREAIALMGELAQKYGYGDWGECLTVADKHEVWQFEIVGSGPGKPSALWAAQRIPDDHVGVSANIPRIGKIEWNNPDYFMYSPDLKERAKKLGYWDGKEEFIFHKVISGKKPFSVREYFIFNTLAPSLQLSYDADELPFSIKPDKKVSPQQILEFYRATYEGTEFDPCKNLWVEVPRTKRLPDGTRQQYKDTICPVSPFMPNDLRALLNKLEPDVAERVRTIAVIQCSYSHIIQLRDWLPDEIGGVAYFSYDNPAQSPRIPIYAGINNLPESFAICGQHIYREDAAVWAFRETNRISTIDWYESREILEPEVMSFEEKMFEMAPMVEEKALKLIQEGKVEEAKKVLTTHTNDFATQVMGRWKELKGKVLMLFVRSM